MRLSKLTLTGFKSFADRTEFTFDEAWTGVVGPNGCGKSNVVDAIKWVLGERSSKSLRGKEMIDVIFAGSAGRQPSGMASVALTFENPMEEGKVSHSKGYERAAAEATAVAVLDVETDTKVIAHPEAEPESDAAALLVRDMGNGVMRRGLPIDADVVEVERRLYRDGESAYLINGKRARLKDIRDLFLDTGIGADAYSIIEQGKVDAMLLASAQERRTIFEEAAGIAKYKQRRVEAQRKLERAQTNLTLTREQLASTERRLKIVKGQAVKARKFKELDAQLRATRMAMAFDQYDDLRQRLDALTSSLSQLEETRKDATAKLAEVEAAKQEAELARHELVQKHRELEEQRLAAQHSEQSASQRKSMTERAMEDARQQSETDAARLLDVQTRIAELTKAAEEQAQVIAAAAERLSDVERQIEVVSSERAGVLEQRAEKQSALAERRAAVANIDRERASLLASIESDRKREESIHEQVNKADARRVSLSGERTRVEGLLVQSRLNVDSRKGRVSELEGLSLTHDERAASLSRDRRELAEKVSGLEQTFLKKEGRRATLAEMVRSRVGLGDAARAVLAARDSGKGYAGIIAPLADMISTDASHAAAVEAALAMDLQALVVESIASMPGKEELAALPGRVTLVPFQGLGATVESQSPDESMLASGRVTPLRSVVSARVDGQGGHDPRVSALLDRLLGRTYLVEDLDSALMLGATISGARFVTRDGSVMEPDGRVQAGPAEGGEASGVLQRWSELADLEVEVSRLTLALETERAGLSAVDADAAAISAQQTELRSRLAGEQRGLVQDQTRFEQLSSELARLERDARNADEEAQQHRTRLVKLEEDRARLSERAEKLLGLHGEQVAAAKGLEEALQTILVRAEAANEQITALRVESSKLGEQLSAARREHRRVELASEASEREIQELERLVMQSRSRLEEHEQAIAEAGVQIQQAAADVARLVEEVAAVGAQVNDAVARATDLGELLNSARQHATRVDRDWHGLEVSRREQEIKRENLEERTLQEMEVDLAAEYADYREMVTSGEVQTIDQVAAASEVDVLREQIKALGNVNLEALEEETQLEARNEELIKQVADIDDASQRLAELIEKLNLASKDRFGEVFTKVQEHFGGPNGMFRKLFGGGHAEVKLMPLVKEIETPEGIKKVETGEIDLLESGVEVIAKPPGKQPRSISQLSGGEKTLTAVALLLAIFQSKPSCFCVLDEVDAALDEANVGRYCGVIREFTSHSHFIVITHNKKTMQAADRLYGVTMQERGVSTRVSVKFDQVGSNGEVPVPSGGPSASEGSGAPNGETPKDGPMRRGLAKMRKESPVSQN